MGKLDKSTLGYLGAEFQYQLIKAFMEEPGYFGTVNNMVDPNMFTDSFLRVYVGVLKEYFKDNEVTPSYSMMNIKLREKSNTDIDVETYDGIIKKLRTISCEGVDDIKEMAVKFFKQQKITRAANEILRLVSNGDADKTDEIEKIMAEAVAVEEEEDMGTSPLDNLDEVLSDEYRVTIPTGIGRIDALLEGGLGKGELGAIIGPSSFGKTSLTTAICNFAATYRCEANDYNGFKVLQIVFEDRKQQIQRKHIGRMTGVESKDLSKPQFIDKVKERIANYEDKDLIKNNIRIKKYPSGEKTASDIRAFLKKLINSGFRPDMLIVDYFECVEPERTSRDKSNESEWTREGRIMRRFETIASEFNIALWIPVQGTKESVGAEVVTMDKAGGSFKKMQVAHIIMSISRTMEMIADNKAKITILKNRAGKAGGSLDDVDFNNGTCMISTDDVTEYEDIVDYKASEKERKREKENKITADELESINGEDDLAYPVEKE